MRTKTYKEMRSEGLCTKCGKPNSTPEHCMCPECAHKNSVQKKERRKYMKRIGKCTRCGNNEAEPGKSMCLECLGKDSDDYYSKYKERKLEKSKIYDRKRAEYLRNNKICTHCRKRPSETGLCDICKAYLKRYREKSKTDIYRSERVSYGICYICGKSPVLPRKGVCEECYGVRIASINKCNEIRNPNFNEYWKKSNRLIFGG